MVYLLFKGARFDFLVEQIAAYEASVAGGTSKEFLDVVYARYARRFPIELPLTEDPSPEFLASVNDDDPEPENEATVDDLSPEELEVETKKIAERQMEIQKRRKQIASWFHYRHMKQHTVDPRSTDPSNPFTALLFSITGIHPSEKPRQKSAVNCWSKTQANSINQLVRQWCITNGVVRKNSMAVWNRIAKEEFSKLPEDKQRHWERKAKEDHSRELEEWKAAREAAISTSPEDRQRCIEGIVRLGQEFLDKLAEATGWKWSLIGGGPEPVSEGRLTVISLHGGTTNGEVKLNFGQKERELYLSQILPVFSKFLRACYTPEECRSRALIAADTIPLEEAGLEDIGMSFDLVCPPETSTTAETLHPTAPSTTAPRSDANEPTVHAPAPVAAANSTIPADAPPEASAMELDEEPPCTPPCTPSPPPSVVPSPLGSPFQSPSRQGRSMTPPSSPSAHYPPTPSAAATNASVPPPLSSSAPPPPTPSAAAANASMPTHCTSNPTPPVDDEAPVPTIPPPTPQGLSSRTNSRKRQASAARDAAPLKRARGSLSTSSSTAAAARPSSAVWFQNALQMFETDSLGAPWSNLVQAWIRFEESPGHGHGSLSAKGRPSAVGEWIQRARKPSYRPVIKDSKAYGDKHVAWWASLQPEWRVLGDDDLNNDDTIGGGVDDDNHGIRGDGNRGPAGLLREEGGDFEALRKPGANGLLSVLASLYFWGTSVKNSGKKSKRWDQSVEDCTYVLDSLSPPA